ncbi:AraC family transcriptional regulator [Paenibacillus sacheonensis]|uniref:Helix-turn-helix domain-containing protein n=1 Tax=Paenibacillus sacheonensis TaxID=742054 RepID=A0A7X4YT20_9BACL|nr:AraC family transcriptional regulator [Paenibacillus sacheonensis]MBM7563628.1 AraC-like DNA-binding protein [Paenibacillus sacheonensis]NBC71076.1 helix-turn-helix domain-containing protein [Paenibacillus sacheonensis]
MNMKREHGALTDLLHTLQIDVLTAHKTLVTRDWQDFDFVPEYNKFYYILEGEGWLKSGDAELTPVSGDLCMLPAYINQSYSALKGRPPFLKYWCHFTTSIGPFDLFQWIGAPLFIPVIDREEMDALFKLLVSLRTNSSVVARLREKSVMLEIISRYLEHVPITILQHRSEDLKRIQFIQSYIDGHMEGTLKVEDMARAAHLHPNYFIAYFKKHFGVSPLKYMNRRRADKAKILLSTTALSIKDIADQTGFKETNHFAKFFRKETGQSPTEYRLLHGGS